VKTDPSGRSGDRDREHPIEMRFTLGMGGTSSSSLPSAAAMACSPAASTASVGPR
jgi:hypothetical protein